jgi:hypothetical protein
MQGWGMSTTSRARLFILPPFLRNRMVFVTDPFLLFLSTIAVSIICVRIDFANSMEGEK